ncbi:MAG: PQQ-binding-like beta-propeller repeat protein [Planctomycetota bacterium]
MEGTEVAPAPGWMHPPDATAAETVRLLAGETLHMQTHSRQMAFADVRSGRVVMEIRQHGRRTRSTPAANLIHPLVVDGTVVYRTDRGVVARDLLSGRRLWTNDELPLFRSVVNQYPADMTGLGDRGNYHLTSGGGLVFVRCRLDPPVARRQGRHVMRGAAPLRQRTSTLRALRLEDGRTVWPALGDGRGPDEVVRKGDFVSPVTYSQGRAYFVMLHAARYHAVCIDAQRGKVLWRQPICQTPALTQNRSQILDSLLFGRVSPPVVAAGRMIVCTNAGVTAALDAATGQPLWAYHYPSRVNVAGGAGAAEGITEYPVNPLVVAADRVVCLPADSQHLFALSAAGGRPLWSAERDGQRHLSAVDDRTVLLSQPGLMLVSASDGTELHRSAGDLEVYGRPAVTPRRVVTSAPDALVSFDLETRRVRRKKLGTADALLGNLVSCETGLVAANPAGVCAYFRFDEVRGGLAERIRRVEPEQRAALLLTQGQVAFNAGRYDLAAEDFAAARDVAERTDMPVAAGRARSWAYRTQIALANRTDDHQQRTRHFERALELAGTDQERAHTLLRLAKCREDAGDLPAAAEYADTLRAEYGDEEIADVAVGSAARDTERIGADRPTRAARERVRRFLRRLIEQHGRDFYAALERRAQAALDDALDKGGPEPLLVVRDRWPNSRAAECAVYRAAEAHYRAASAAAGEPARRRRDAARRLLAWLAQAESGEMRLAAGMVLACMYHRDGQLHVARDRARAVLDDPDFDASLEVDFADIQGRAETLLRELLGESNDAEKQAALNVPLQKSWALDEPVAILRDQHGRPVRPGGRLAAVGRERLMLIDPTAGDARAAVVAGAEVPLSAEAIHDRLSWRWGRDAVAGLSDSGAVLVVAVPQGAYGFDARSGEPRWKRTTAALDLETCQALAVADGLVLLADIKGKLRALDAATGEPRGWTAGHLRGRRYPASVDAAGGLAVVTYQQSSSELSGHAATVCVFDLGTGKLRARWKARQRAWAHVSDAGLLAVLIDDELAVHRLADADGASFDQPLWTRTLSGSGDLLDADGQRVALRTKRGVEVLALSGCGTPEIVSDAPETHGAVITPWSAYVLDTNMGEGDSGSGAPRLEGIAIDGCPDDWGEQGLRVERLHATKSVAAADFSARFRVGWCAKGLLVLAEVQDDRGWEHPDDGSLWRGDSAELFLAPRRGSYDFYQVGVSPGRIAGQPAARQQVYDKRRSAELRSIPIRPRSASSRTGTGYVLEVLLPWAPVGADPSVGDVVGVQLQVNDKDPDDEWVRLSWHPGNPLENPGNVMHVRLAAAPVASRRGVQRWVPGGTMPAWSVSLAPSEAVRRVVPAGDHVLLVMRDGGLRIVHARTGRPVQRLAADGDAPKRAPSPVVADGRLLVETSNRVIVYAPAQ